MYNSLTGFILDKAKQTSSSRPLVIAIDGRCASGKTTLAEELAKASGGTVIHADDFFLRPFQRTEKRLKEPGGNFDRERFKEEILLPLKSGKRFSFYPYDCSEGKLGKAVAVEPSGVYIIEGSYSCHPELIGFYDFTVFLTVNPEEQARRIIERNGSTGADAFFRKWIPLEELYFRELDVQSSCFLILNSPGQ